MSEHFDVGRFRDRDATGFLDRAIETLDDDAEVFHVMYDLAEREQIPGICALMNNQTWEKGGRPPHLRGIADDEGRVRVAVNFNQDIGDAWEHANDARYPARHHPGLSTGNQLCHPCNDPLARTL